MSFLGIDIGTSGLRVLLVDPSGAPIGSAESAYSTAHPHAGWSEQDPADWCSALETCVAALREAHPEFTELNGIGVAGHMHGAVVLDADDAVLHPCIMWNDTRAQAEASRLDGTTKVRDLSGNIVFAGFTAPKLEWLRTHAPDTYARIAKVLLPAAYLNLYLTGAHISDMSDAAGTSWLDVRRRAWSEDLLSAGHMKQSQMPRLVEGAHAAGQLRDDVKTRWGLSDDVVVAGGAGDNAAAACGIGAMAEGQGFVSLGTSGVVLMARGTCCPAPETAVHTFCHALPDRWYQMGVMLSAADCLSWFSKITGTAPDALTEALGDDLRPPSPLRFAPYLSGERTPHNDAKLRAGFDGIGAETTREDMTHALLTGICFGLRDCMEAIKATGGQFETLYAIGGGAASTYWLTLLATVLQTPLLIPEGREFGAALGAARLGMTAAGADIDTVMRAPKVRGIIRPDDALVQVYEAAYEEFRNAHTHTYQESQT